MLATFSQPHCNNALFIKSPIELVTKLITVINIVTQKFFIT